MDFPEMTHVFAQFQYVEYLGALSDADVDECHYFVLADFIGDRLVDYPLAVVYKWEFFDQDVK
jgi:hypothetical protein